MTIILFLVDTSASMLQRINSRYGRIALIDLAKTAIETFISVRQYKSDSSGDRYMLLTFEEFPNNIKAGWKENLTTFMNELKNLECNFRTVMGAGLRQAFDLLNLNRMQSGIDTYGQGRSPFYVESALIILITDGGLYFNSSSVSNELSVPLTSQVPGSELTTEPFRWDQRLYALILRLPGTLNSTSEVEYVPRDYSHIDMMCEVTGGRSYCITTQQMLFQCIESLVYKVQDGVIIRFEMIQSEPSSYKTEKLNQPQATSSSTTNPKPKSWQSIRNLIYVSRSSRKHAGYWPIPEAYWPDVTISTLPPRNAQPKLVYQCINTEPIFHKSIPWDKYKLEPSPLTQNILARKQKNICWQVFVLNSGKHTDSCHAIGYLKVSTKLSCVYLIVLPYNFPVLIPLIDELTRTLKYKPSHDWIKKFHGYLSTVPMYYHSLLKSALTSMGFNHLLLQTIMPKFIISQLNYTLQNYLQNIRNRAKIEHEILCDHVFNRGDIVAKKRSQLKISCISMNPISKPKQDYITHPTFTRKFYPSEEYQTYLLQVAFKRENEIDVKLNDSTNVSRNELLKTVAGMRTNFFRTPTRIKSSKEEKDKHNMPIMDMGNYMDYIKKLSETMLREIEPNTFYNRRNLFGNPFKNNSFMIDEADADDETTVSGLSIAAGDDDKSRESRNEVKWPRRRRQGPLPKSYSIVHFRTMLEEQFDISECKRPRLVVENEIIN